MEVENPFDLDPNTLKCLHSVSISSVCEPPRGPPPPPPIMYSRSVEHLREHEYGHMSNGVYLDHGGATIYARSMVEEFALSMMTNLYGNPHSQNGPAKRSGDMVDEIRLKTLRFLGADPEHFDLVFVANATAAIKMVGDSFRDLADLTRSGKFWYGYHKDSHTSIVGIRELTGGDCEVFESDEEVEDWLHGQTINRSRSRWRSPASLGLFAYPGQSNMNGRRLPQSWLRRIRENRQLRNVYTLFDAAALAMTAPLNDLFADVNTAPDFTSLSFYKIFGFPDMGALIVRKSSGHILNLRKYFGGGTISQLTAIGKRLMHISKGRSGSIHSGLEDGTLPFHSILALGISIDTHRRLFTSMHAISRHTTALSRIMYEGIRDLRHPDGRPVCRIYADDHEDGGEAYGDAVRQGPTIAFNVMRADGSYVEWSEVEKLANECGVYIRAGGVCCPGGIATALKYEAWEWERMFSAGHACGIADLPLVHDVPTGIVRASLGAMSTRQDVDALISFLRGTFILQHRRPFSTDSAIDLTHRCKCDSCVTGEGGSERGSDISEEYGTLVGIKE